MTKINELIIDGVKTSSFKCEILVETRPQIRLFVNCSGLKSAKLEKGQILSFLF
ncbi:Uncharacterised protein [Streptococcus pneumoniae]|nr:Uncharacterised protein [Streptococcus pneumoniae]